MGLSAFIVFFSDADFQTNANWTNVHSINLTLVNVTSEDNGFLLTCIAENVVGMSNASVLLTVNCKSLIGKLGNCGVKRGMRGAGQWGLSLCRECRTSWPSMQDVFALEM